MIVFIGFCLIQLAAEILDFLLEEEENVVEVWYLLGWMYKLKGAGFEKNSKFYLESSLKVAKSVQYEDQAVLEHIKKMIEELGECKRHFIY